MNIEDEKVVFNYDDTYSLDHVLSPIIAEGLKKFVEVLREKEADPENDSFGIPGELMKREAGKYTNEELSEASKEWFAIIEKMIYAFEVDEPDMEDGVMELVASDDADENGNFSMKVEVLDQEAYDKHYAEVELHSECVKEGLQLFAKHYNDLWW